MMSSENRAGDTTGNADRDMKPNPNEECRGDRLADRSMSRDDRLRGIASDQLPDQIIEP